MTNEQVPAQRESGASTVETTPKSEVALRELARRWQAELRGGDEGNYVQRRCAELVLRALDAPDALLTELGDDSDAIRCMVCGRADCLGAHSWNEFARERLPAQRESGETPTNYAALHGILHELEVGGASTSDVDEVRWCAEMLRSWLNEPPLLSERAEPHHCDWCSIVTRDLFATAFNAANSAEYFIAGQEGIERLARKIATLRRSLANAQKELDAHFAAMESAGTAPVLADPSGEKP